MYDKSPLAKIQLPDALPPLLARILEDWRGMYRGCKTRQLRTTISQEDFERLRALADSFLAAFRDDPRVSYEEETYQLWSSMLVQGPTQSFRFPFDLFIAESHANVLPALARRLRNTPTLDEGAGIDQIAHALSAITLLLKKNDVRLLTPLSEPAFWSAMHYLFPIGTLSSQLSSTD